MEIYSSKRTFQMWQYTIGHGQLLLRSNKSPEYSTQIEILFKNVSVIKLAIFFHELYVRIGEKKDFPDELKEALIRIKEKKIFIVTCKEFTGYVIAGAFFTHEDEKEYSEPSSLLSLPSNP